MDKLVLAYEVAKKFHEGQKDRAGKPYINHVKFVSDQVLPLGEEYALVGMLHDTLEDTAMDRGTLEQLFGKTVADAVALLTHDKKVPYLDYVRQIKESGNPYAIAVK
ncbi:HD domain-containing protein, partial [uncultured Acidaminococcus sp.]